MSEKNMAFVLVKDRTYKNPAENVFEYMRFKHPDIPRHKVLSVEDSIKILLAELKKGDNIGSIHLYSHANNLGYVWGRLRTKDYYRGIAPNALIPFAKNNKSVQQLSGFGWKETTIYVHGCNLGKSPESLRYWRNIFGGAKGRGIAPNLFQHFVRIPHWQKAVWNKKVLHKQKISHADEIRTYVNSAIKAAEDKEIHLRPEAKKVLTENAYKSLDQWLFTHYQFMVKGGELPANWQNLSKEQCRVKMRELFNTHHGILTTFLFNRFTETLWTKEGNIRKVMKPKGAIFPEDPAWKSSHRIESS